MLSFSKHPSLPAWRAFGPGAPRLPGWVLPPRSMPLPRTALRSDGGAEGQWPKHLDRLLRGGMELGWAVAWLQGVEPDILDWLSVHGLAACRVQLFPDALSVRLETIPSHPLPYRMLAVPHPLGDLRGHPRAMFKGLLGAWDQLARDQAREEQADDALLLWPDLTLAETTLAAIALQREGKLFLPPLAGRVGSITEASALPFWASSRGLAIEHRPIGLEEVLGGQLWCMNAVRGLWQAEVVKL